MSPAPLNLRRVEWDGRGALWLSAMPGAGGNWASFVDDARRARLDLCVCLTPRYEVDRLSPAYARAIDSGALPFDWLHLPMRNLGLAAELDAFEAAIDNVAARLRGGAGVLLHCAHGIGRTGTAAACVLLRLGLPRSDALQRVREAGSSPESIVQSGLIQRFGRRPA